MLLLDEECIELECFRQYDIPDGAASDGELVELDGILILDGHLYILEEGIHLNIDSIH